MIFLAQFRFGTRLEMILGEFSFLVEASSQEEAVKNEEVPPTLW